MWRLLPRWDIYSEQISYDNDHENCNPQRDFDLSPILELNKYSLYFTNYPYEIGIKFESLDTKILLYEYILINSLAKRVSSIILGNVSPCSSIFNEVKVTRIINDHT